MVYCGVFTENLFAVEYDTPYEILRYKHLLRLSDLTLYNKDNNSILSGSNYYPSKIFDTLPKGIYTGKARIVNKVEKWNLLTAWEFSLACVERVFREVKENVKLQKGEWPDICDQALNYIKVYGKWYFNQQKYRHLNYYTKYIGNKLNKNYREGERDMIFNELNNWAEHYPEFGYWHLANALLKIQNIYGYGCLDAARDARSQIGIIKYIEYSEKYNIPSFSEDEDMYTRIHHALRIDEFVWQIHHLMSYIY